jgi:hypothetical protein
MYFNRLAVGESAVEHPINKCLELKDGVLHARVRYASRQKWYSGCLDRGKGGQRLRECGWVEGRPDRYILVRDGRYPCLNRRMRK